VPLAFYYFQGLPPVFRK